MQFIKKYAHYSILLLMLTGWFLNGKYYYSRFVSEGFDFRIAIIISTALVIFASFNFAGSQFMKKRKNKLWTWILRIVYFLLALYSINCTTAGQYWDQQIKNQESNTNIAEQENKQYLLDEYKEKKEYYQGEIKRITAIQSSTIKTLDDAWTYEEEYKYNEKLLTQLKSNLLECEKKIEEILEENKISAKADNINKSKQLYEFYRDFFKIQFIVKKENKGHELVQFIFQLLLSIFIEAIAQVSIYIFMQLNDKKEIQEKKEEIKITRDKLQAFCIYAWNEIEMNGKKYLTTKNEILRLSTQYNQKITSKDFDYIVETGLKAGLLQRKNGNIKPVEHAKRSDLFYNKILNILEV